MAKTADKEFEMFTKPPSRVSLEARLNQGVSRPLMAQAAHRSMVDAVIRQREAQLEARARETEIINAALAKKDKI